MIVRPARQEDISAIVEIVERCGLGVGGLDYTKWTGVVLVAERQAQVVGFIAAIAGAPYAVITEMGVLPEHQKGRAAVKLWEALEIILRSLGVTAWSAFIGEKREIAGTMPKLGAVNMGTGSMWLKRL